MVEYSCETSCGEAYLRKLGSRMTKGKFMSLGLVVGDVRFRIRLGWMRCSFMKWRGLGLHKAVLWCFRCELMTSCDNEKTIKSQPLCKLRSPHFVKVNVWFGSAADVAGAGAAGHVASQASTGSRYHPATSAKHDPRALKLSASHDLKSSTRFET